MEQLFALTLHHTGDRDACPTRYHFCDIISRYFLANQRVAILSRCQLLLDSLDIIFEDLQF